MQKSPLAKTTIHKTSHGCILSDAGCNVIQLEFGNLFLRFDAKGLENFKACIDHLLITLILSVMKLPINQSPIIARSL
jgi:hypothetical protein